MADPLIAHGTRTAYERFGCRCPLCVDNHRAEPRRLMSTISDMSMTSTNADIASAA